MKAPSKKNLKEDLQEPLDDPAKIEKPDLALLGPRQEAFLSDWIQDWDDVDMKVLLTQTVFANVATHHGNYDGSVCRVLDALKRTGRTENTLVIFTSDQGSFFFTNDAFLYRLNKKPRQT